MVAFLLDHRNSFDAPLGAQITMGRQDKLVVTFDEKSRLDFVTGFRKRRIQRKKAAVHQKEVAVKQEQSERRAERRAELRALLAEGESAAAETAPPPAETVSASFADDFSKRVFGAENVIVSTTIGSLDDDADDDGIDSALRGYVESAAKRRRIEHGHGEDSEEEEKPKKSARAKPKLKKGVVKIPKGKKHNTGKGGGGGSKGKGKGKGKSGGGRPRTFE